MSNCDIIDSPIRFLGATVLSFNTNLGLGSSESTLTVDLIEDCENGDLFQPSNNLVTVGDAVYFSAGEFTFGGILRDWNVTQGRSGQTFKVSVSDPRQLLENCVVVVDSYLGPPTTGNNYINVYRHFEGTVLDGNCDAFGTSGSSERGMPYTKIISGLISMSPKIYSPMGATYSINFNSFPQNIPQYYRIPGPSITILQLLTNVCDILGYEFYVDLLPGNVINIGLISLNSPPPSFESIINAYDGVATELSYGQELRNEVTKMVLFGQQQYYCSIVKRFQHYFGADLVNGRYFPVVPIGWDNCGFWVAKRTDTIDAILFNKIGDGPFLIHELDIRAAMSNMDLWLLRVFDTRDKKPANLPNKTLNQRIREVFQPQASNIIQKIRDAIAAANAAIQAANAIDVGNDEGQVAKDEALAAAQEEMERALGQAGDILLNPQKRKKELFLQDKKNSDMEALHNWVRNLGTTFYGKQFIVPLEHPICYYQQNDSSEIIYSDVPTSEGGWVEYTGSVLGLSEPKLSFFRLDDGRVEPFALFNTDGKAPDNKKNNQPNPQPIP